MSVIAASYPLEHHTNRSISEGKDYPLGATLTNEGANFAIYSQDAEAVFLLLFEHAHSHEPTDIIEVTGKTRSVWHVHVDGIQPNQIYGFKVRGPWEPELGLRFNDAKLLLDPYAKALTHKCRNQHNLLLAYKPEAAEDDTVKDLRDNTSIMPKCIVIEDGFDWKGDCRLELPHEDLIIYEAHLKGFTAHPSSGVAHPGTYLGFIEKIPYLKELGINAVEFLPLQEFYHDDFLTEKGLSNYWGYNTIAFFAPESGYSTQCGLGCQVREFKTLVRELHAAGIEVIMDVVYNHTAEGNNLGPTLNFKGIDNRTYYHLTGPEGEPGRYYMDYSGCGNSVNFDNLQTIRLAMDSLRYWVEEMHVDGFRFDLASVLGRQEGQFRTTAAFFAAIAQDPSLNGVKMIAEPWDIATYQIGNFPQDWSEWNGKFRDPMRSFLKGDGGLLHEVARRLTGSHDLYGQDGREPYQSINFITCHDGFTMRDLVSYDEKHNESNLEDNRDGSMDNHSWNCGVEGETDDEEIIGLRKCLCKNALSYLLFSVGTPMLLHGDEVYRTQGGNNNAYCQDNEITWIDWDSAREHLDILRFAKLAIRFRKDHPVLRRKRFFTGEDTNGDSIPDCKWFSRNLDSPIWHDPEGRLLCYQLDGEGLDSPTTGFHLFIILNSHWESHRVILPQHEGLEWYRVVDTSLPFGEDFRNPGDEVPLRGRSAYQAPPRSVIVLKSK